MATRNLRNDLNRLKAKLDGATGGYCPHSKAPIDLIFEMDGTLRPPESKPCPHCSLPRQVRFLAALNGDEDALLQVPEEWLKTYLRASEEVKGYLGFDPALV